MALGCPRVAGRHARAASDQQVTAPSRMSPRCAARRATLSALLALAALAGLCSAYEARAGNALRNKSACRADRRAHPGLTPISRRAAAARASAPSRSRQGRPSRSQCSADAQPGRDHVESDRVAGGHEQSIVFRLDGGRRLGRPHANRHRLTTDDARDPAAAADGSTVSIVVAVAHRSGQA